MAEDNKVIFSMVGVSKTIPPQKKILNNIYLSFFYGAKIGILGLNGAGKSTLMKIIAGVEKSYEGQVVFSPGYSVGYLEQEPKLDPQKTVREVVEEGTAEIVALLKEYEEVNLKFGEPMSDDEMTKLIERQGELTELIDQHNGWELDNTLERAMDALRCPPADWKIENLSGGERRRVALCRLLLQEPDILLLDEPTNHLDAESVQWLEAHLQQYKGTVIAVTHDRYFLDNVAGWILELDRGEGIPWKGNYSSWLEQKTKRLEMEEKTESRRRKTLERELEWVRMAPKARQAKQKARLNAYDRLLNEDTKETVLEVEIGAGVDDPDSGEKEAEFDFKEVKDEGNYHIEAGDVVSASFRIAEDVYDDIFKASIKMLYYQRCGTELTSDLAGDFAHPVCHNDEAVLYEDNSVKLDVSGGWHDAGDYGRYSVAGAKAAADLLLAYENYPGVFGDDLDVLISETFLRMLLG